MKLSGEARETIRARRIALGLTQGEAAASGGIAGTTWNTVEVGKSDGSDLVRAAIARALQWTPDSIDRLERGEDPVETTAPGKADDAADPATLAAYQKLAEKVSALEVALERYVGKQTLRELIAEEDRSQSS